MTSKYHSSIRYDIVPLVSPARRLLDVGGGTGATALHLKRVGLAQEIGVMDAVIESGTPEIEYTSNANLNSYDEVEEFLVESGPFDTILLLDILEHLVDPWERIDQLTRHVSPGGALIASIPNIRQQWLIRDLIFHNRWQYTDAGLLDRTHLRFFTRTSAMELMARSGLSIETVEPSPLEARRYRFFNAVTLGLIRSFFTRAYLIVSRREPA